MFSSASSGQVMKFVLELSSCRGDSVHKQGMEDVGVARMISFAIFISFSSFVLTALRFGWSQWLA